MNPEINEQAKESLEKYPSIDLSDDTFMITRQIPKGNNLLYKILSNEGYYYVVKMEVLAISDDSMQARYFLGYFADNRD